MGYFFVYSSFNQTYAVYVSHFATAKWDRGISTNLSVTQVRLLTFPL